MLVNRPQNNGLMANMFREQFKEMADEIANQDQDFAYSTGNNLFDTATGSVIYDENNVAHLMGGLYARMYTVVGISGVGKTTKTLQLAAGVVENYGGHMWMLDCEANTQASRIKSLTGWNDMQYNQYCTYMSGSITVLDLYNLIRKIVYLKEKNKKDMQFEIPIRNANGEKRKVYIPSVIFLDSVPSLTLLTGAEEKVDAKKDYKDLEALGSNIDGAREAKDNTAFIKKMKPYLAKYGIILININHISKEMPTGMFDRPKKHHPNLKAGEKVKGGHEWIYQSFGMTRHDQKEAINERNRIYGDSIDGAIVNLELVKNKAGVSGIPHRVVFDKATGWRTELSDFEYLWQTKYGFSGSPSRMCLDLLPSVGFTRKSLINVCRENPKFARTLRFTAKLKMMADMTFKDNNPWFFDLKKFASKYSEEEILAIIFAATPPYPFYPNFGYDYHDPVVFDKVYKFDSRKTGINPCNQTISLMDPIIPRLIYASIVAEDKRYVFDLNDKGIGPYDEDYEQKVYRMKKGK